MKIVILASAALLAIPAAASAQQARTVTYEGQRYEGTRTTTVDRQAGTVSRDGTLTRRSDGAVATRSYDRQRTETGAVATGSTTNFEGQTRGFDFERTRTARGYRGEGTATGFDGQSYELRSAGRRGPNGGAVRYQGVRNSDGELVAGRRVAVRRGPAGGVSRSVQRLNGPRRR
jgi:hypothetical protein